MNYEIDDLQRRYEELDERKKSGLESFWDDIIGLLEETDRDWLRKEDMKSELGIENREFSHSYDAFLEVFDPPQGVGNSFAFYKMDYGDLVEAGEELELGEPPEIEAAKDNNPADRLLKEDYDF